MQTCHLLGRLRQELPWHLPALVMWVCDAHAQDVRDARVHFQPQLRQVSAQLRGRPLSQLQERLYEVCTLVSKSDTPLPASHMSMCPLMAWPKAVEH